MRITYLAICCGLTLSACSTPKRMHVAGVGPAPLQDEKFDSSIAEFTSQLRQVTDRDERASLYSRRGSAFGLAARHNESIQDHSEAIRLNPKLTAAYVGRGMAYYHKQQPDNAVRDFTTAIRLNPNTWEAYYLRGLARMDARQWNRAIADFDKAVKYNPQHADSFRQLASCYIRQNNFERAFESFTAAIAVDPSDITAHSGRGRLHARVGEWEKAEADHTIAIKNLCVPMKLYPKSLPPSVLAEVYLDRATVYLNQNQIDKAARDCNAAIKLQANAVQPYLQRAAVYGKKRDYLHQLSDLKSAVNLNSRHDSALNALAWFRATCPEAALRNGKEAVQLAISACALTKWENLSYIDTLAAAHAELNDFEKAINYEGRVLAKLDTRAARANASRRLELYRHHKAYRQEP